MVQPDDSQLLGMKLAALWIAVVLWLSLDSAEQVGWPGLLTSESLGWLRCIPLQLVLVAVAVEMSVAQMLTLHLRSWKVAVAVVAGADGSFPLLCFGVWMLLRSFTASFVNV